MIRFDYNFLDLGPFDLDTISGFQLSLGNDEEWDDVVISFQTRGRKFNDYISIPVSKEWIDKVCTFINEQRQLKGLSSWVYKKPPHTTEHRISIETDSWNTDIYVYNFGSFGRHFHPEYENDEKILIEFFKKMQEFLREIGIELSFNKYKKI